MNIEDCDILFIESPDGKYYDNSTDPILIDKEMFLKTYGRNMNGVDNYSMEEHLCSELANALKYFKYIASLNYWDYMLESGLD